MNLHDGTAVISARLWNVLFADGSLWFARGVGEEVARKRANKIPGASVVTSVHIPAQQTDWTPA